jgi:hypothetical protein
VNATGWSRGLEVTGGGTGIVSHAGPALLRQLSDRTGLTSGLSAGLPSPLGGHDRGRVFADLACAIADRARVISDFRVMGDQPELFGPVASVPTAWRALNEMACRGDRGRRKVTAAVSRARRHAWAQGIARPGALPPVRVADRKLAGVTCIRLDATVVPACSAKEPGSPSRLHSRICTASMAFTLNSRARHSLSPPEDETSNDAAGFASCYGPHRRSPLQGS